MAVETPLDRFKAVLGGTARALSDEPELELTFTADAPARHGRPVPVPRPARPLPPAQVAGARGCADPFAHMMCLPAGAITHHRCQTAAAAPAGSHDGASP